MVGWGGSCLAAPSSNEKNITPILSSLLLAKAEIPNTTKVVIGSDGVVKAFKGKKMQSAVKVFVGYTVDERTNYTYTLITGPTGMIISSQGVITYNVPSTSDTKAIPITIRVTSIEGGWSKLESAQVVIMATEVIASGVIGSEGGVISDEWEDVVLTVPVDAVTEQTTFEVLRGIDEKGYYIYTVKSSTPLLKALQLRLPDPQFRKAPQDSNTIESSEAFKSAQSQKDLIPKKREASNGWNLWRYWSANYAKITSGIGAENRLRNDLPDNSEPANDNIDNNYHHDAAALFSLCSAPSYSETCGDKDPVLFIHGYSPGGDLGGGKGTWGQLPELIANEDYAVFEFNWRTNARFVDAATNLADAIRIINLFSHKKVHIIAHSFGGLVSRAYLQNYAVGRPYHDDVQSLLTLGTPHSGIFDEDGTYHGLSFLKGQDSRLFKACLQISCQQAGESTPNAWTVEQFWGPNIDFSFWFGIDTDPGKFIAQIDDTAGDHKIPVNVLALMGLPRNANKTFQNGDGLITYAGQRFDRTWRNTKVHQNPLQIGEGEVTERILGVTVYDSDALPGDTVSNAVLSHWGPSFWGYFHSTAVPAYIAAYPIGAAEPNVSNSSIVHTGSDAPHAALTEIKAWLRLNHSAPFTPLTITLNTQVVDATTQLPISGANVYFNVNGSQVSSAETFGVTNENGQLSIELPFYALSKYTALVTKNGYHNDEFDTGYTTGLTPGWSGAEFGRLELQPDQVATGDLSGQIVNATTGLAIPNASYTLIRNSLDHTGVTDSSGNYSISGLIIGTYELRLSKTGYQNETYFITIHGGQSNNGSANMREILSDGQMSIRLTWDVDPSDLDSHLVKYDASGTQQYHIYYSHKSDSTTGDNLDLDDTSSYGPETTTIQSVEASARYVFAVYHYSGSGSITTTSNAHVSVGYGSNSTVTFNAPTSGEGRWWKVFEINNGSIVPCQNNCILDDQGSVFNATARSRNVQSKSETAFMPDWLLDIMANEMPAK